MTHNTQPCLLATSVALFRVVQEELNYMPDAVMGHSLGEYSALVAIQAIDLASAVRWVRERGIAMQKAVSPGEGGMLAILGLSDSQVLQICQQATTLAHQNRQLNPISHFSIPALVEPANFNGPEQTVVSGSLDALEEVRRLLKEEACYAGGKGIPLQVSAPFHCQLMSPAKIKMEALFALAPNPPRALSCPYVPNRTGRFCTESSFIFQGLVEQIDHPVQWKQSVVFFFFS